MVVVETKHTKIELIHKRYFLELEPAINDFLESLSEYIDLRILDIKIQQLDKFYVGQILYTFVTRELVD